MVAFFQKLLDSSDWPPRWHCGEWTEVHGWLYIISDLLIWAAYFSIPLVILKYVVRKSNTRFFKLYVLFAAFILACGGTHFLDALAFWLPMYRLSALMRLITAVVSWITVFYLVKYLPIAFSLKTESELQAEIEQRTKVEDEVHLLNKRLEQNLQERTSLLESSQKETVDYKYALDESSIVAITDQKGIIIHVNDNFCNISRYSRQELIGQDHRIINSNYHSKDYIRSLWVTIANGKIWRGELRNKAKDGTIYWVDTTIVPFLNEQGKPYQYVAIRADITERKRVEETLQASIKEISNYKHALDKSSIVAITNQKGIITYVNENFCNISKYSQDELIGQDHRIINSKYHPKEFIQGLWKTIASGEIWKGELRNKAKDESIYWVDTTIVPFLDELGKPFQYVAIRTDITDRKRIEEENSKGEIRFRDTLDKMLEGVQIVGFDWRYLYVNHSFTLHAKYTKKELLGYTVMEKFPGIENTEIFKTYQRCFQERIIIHLENEFVFPDGSVGWFELSFQPIPEGIFILSVDITERKNSELAIAELNKRLEQKVKERTLQLEAVNKELESFSYSISHDLRAPLRAIHGYAKMLEEDYVTTLDENGKRLLNVVQHNASRMGTLIDDLLSFSRLGRKEIQKTVVDMNVLIHSVLNDLPKTEAKIILGELHPLWADHSLLKQVLVNLISNAIKYSSKVENPIIEISSVKEATTVTYSIKDNGSGFDMAYIEKLFGVFQRLHSQEEFEGTGIGLAIVKLIIERHKGTIRAEGALEKGATFYFTLPIEKNK